MITLGPFVASGGFRRGDDGPANSGKGKPMQQRSRTSTLHASALLPPRAAILGALLAWAAPAGAVELFDVVPLEDEGFGSTALAVDTIGWQGEERIAAAGAVTSEDGQQCPAVWVGNRAEGILGPVQIVCIVGFGGGMGRNVAMSV